MTRAKAAKAYVDFHGHEPTEIIAYDLPDGEIPAYRLGTMTAIAYETVRDGKREDYIHEFGDGKGPYIDIGPHSEVYLTEGRFDVTHRGFEDDPMPATLLTINPKARGERGKKKAFPMAKPGRNRKGQFVKASRAAPKARKRARNPVKPLRRSSSRRSSAKPVVVYQETKTVKKRRRSQNPIMGGRRGGKINPISMVINGAQQGAGGIAVSVMAGMIPLPANLKTGVPLAITKVIFAAIIGFAAAKFINPKIGENLATGGATVALYDLMRAYVPDEWPMGQIQQDVPMGAIYSPDMGAWFLQDAETGEALIWQQGMEGWQTINTPVNDMGFATAANTVYDV